MSRHFYLALVLMIAAMVAASDARAVPSYDAWFSGAVSTDWNDVNNWEAQQPPTTDRTAVVGIMGMYEDVTCEVLTGTNAETGGLEIGRYANSTVTVEAGASLHVTSTDTWVSYSGNDSYTNTLNVYGSLTAEAGIHIAGKAGAEVTVAVGGTVTSNGSFNVGMEYHMGGTSAPMGYAYTVDNSGIVTVGASGGGCYITGDVGVSTFYQLNGGTLNALGYNAWTGYGYWHMGGTFEVTADSILNATNEAVIGASADGPPASQWTTPILKFSGTDTTLTANADVYFTLVDGGGTAPQMTTGATAELDVSGLTMTDPTSWLTIINATSITDGDQLAFVAGTDPNWLLQVVGGQVQVKGGPEAVSPLLMGDCNRNGYVDDDDLSLLLANWHGTTTWDYGNLSDNDTPPGVMGYVDDDDLSLLLANWHAGTAPMGGDAVPEPATIALLAVGGLGALIRKRR